MMTSAHMILPFGKLPVGSSGHGLLLGGTHRRRGRADARRRRLPMIFQAELYGNFSRSAMHAQKPPGTHPAGRFFTAEPQPTAEFSA
jgi:hypothetical protein